jgi:hypothetical protein
MKTNLRAFSTLVVCASLLVIGCGSPGTGAVDSYINSVAQASCDWEFRCCTAAEIMQQEMTKFKDAATCLKFRELKLEDQLYAERLAVHQGRIKVDDKQVQLCLAELNAKPCNTPPGMTPPPPPPPGTIDPCTLVFVGNTSIGDACLFADECVKGAHCVPTGAAGEGVCVPYQQEKQICNANADCDPTVKNLYCAQQDYTCHLRSQAGGPCAYTIDPVTMMPTTPLLLECDQTGTTSLYCDSTSMTCKTLPGAGQSCLPLPLPPGATARCDTGLVCDTTAGMPGTCRGPGNVGDTCSGAFPCNSMLYCDNTTTPSTCKTPPGLGGNCTVSNGRCSKPFYCNFNMNPAVCTQPAGLGQMCSFQIQCDTGLYCDMAGATQTCKMLLPDGATCTSGQMCASGQCNFTGGVRTCGPSTTIVQCIGH